MLACCAGWASLDVDSPNQSMGSQLSRADESVRSSNLVSSDSILRCGLVDSALIRLLPRCIESTNKYSQKEMIAKIAQDLNIESFFDYSLLTNDTNDSIKIAKEAKELQKRLNYCSSFIADQISRELTKDPDAAAEKITVKLAGDSNIVDIPFGRESYMRYSNQGKEQNVQLFTLLSSLCTSAVIRPDIWFHVRLGTADIPLLLIEIVSGSSGATSLEQTILKLYSNTIDQLRLYMSLRSSPVSEVSSMVFPKNRGLSTGVTVVTVRFCPDSWKFCASFDNIPISQVCTVMKNILRRHCNILRSYTSSSVSRPWYLVKIYDLPSKTVQIASKHNIVLKQERPGGTVYLKYSPRIRDREQLLELVDLKINSSLDGVNRVAVRPSSWERIKNHRFYVFPVVEPPLSKARILSCFPDFVVKSAEALQILHTLDGLAHLDIRTFNLGYILVNRGEDAKVVFIDLDSSTAELTNEAGNSESNVEQLRPPDSWPETVNFTVLRCDWRQWAMMIWALLQPSQEAKIYEGKLRKCPFPFLEDILNGITTDWDSLSSAELIGKINLWLQSDSFKAIIDQDTRIGESSLVAQVVCCSR
jgi:hypothetical protein